MALRIEDYALIRDCQTAAFVGRDGSGRAVGGPDAMRLCTPLLAMGHDVGL